jgi:hypothetical protein
MLASSSHTNNGVKKGRREVRSLFAPIRPTARPSQAVAQPQPGDKPQPSTRPVVRSEQNPPQAKFSQADFTQQLEAHYDRFISIEDGKLTFKLSDGAETFDVSKIWSAGDLLGLTLFMLQHKRLRKTDIRFAIRRLADKIGYEKTYFRNGQAVSRQELKAQLNAGKAARQ